MEAQDELAQQVAEILQQAHDAGVRYGQAMVEVQQRNVVSSAQGILQRARDIVSGVVDRLQNVLSDAVDRAKQVGVSIADALQEAADALMGGLPDIVGGNEVHAEIENGVMDALTSTGVQQVVWVTEPGACKSCLANEEQGPINLGDAFASGHERPPAHVNCRCNVNPYDGGTNA
jgi:hypothetical protein